MKDVTKLFCFETLYVGRSKGTHLEELLRLHLCRKGKLKLRLFYDCHCVVDGALLIT